MVRALEGIGFARVSQKGSHVKVRRGANTAIVPMHSEIKQGTLHSIARQSGLSWAEFRALLGLG